ICKVSPLPNSGLPTSEPAIERNLRCRTHSSIIFHMTEKEMVLKTVRDLPDDCSIDEIADRIEFLAAVQKGLDQLDRGEGIPHDEIKRQLASWLTSRSGLPLLATTSTIL